MASLRMVSLRARGDGVVESTGVWWVWGVWGCVEVCGGVGGDRFGQGYGEVMLGQLLRGT